MEYLENGSMDKYLRNNKTDLKDGQLLRWTLEVAEVIFRKDFFAPEYSNVMTFNYCSGLGFANLNYCITRAKIPFDILCFILTFGSNTVLAFLQWSLEVQTKR